MTAFAGAVAGFLLSCVLGLSVGYWARDRYRRQGVALLAFQDQVSAQQALVASREADLVARDTEIAALKLERVRLEERLRYDQRAHEERLAALREAQNAVGDAFKGLSQEALARNNELF
jgi:septal ring factor EnvC (AmiA/AmiB activator)